MNLQELAKKIELLEYHQKLLLQIIKESHQPFYRLVIEKRLSEQTVTEFSFLCDDLNNRWEQQKAEGFVYFHPLFEEFSSSIPANIHAKELIEACVNQHFFAPLMRELRKYC
ncbi:MAG: DUF1878 family protein [Bacillota bacterium]|nr:DUF1878 family protein [Bacillota bacterium]MDP4169187.1 DUF1878 family protein [Bacillota bacterium]